MTAKIAPYGTWASPITADSIVAEAVGLGRVRRDGETVYWLENRSLEGGRTVVVQRTPDGQTSDVTPAEFNVRSRVHEYGGGAYIVEDGVVYFSNFSDNRLYRQHPGVQPEPITSDGRMRYADLVVDAKRGRLIAVREDHSEGDAAPVNTIVAVAIDGSKPDVILAQGNDFYASPRLSPDGETLCFITWNHPNMPWDGTELWLGSLDEAGRVTESRLVTGGAHESIFQPHWSPDGVLYFVSDRTNWWNLYRLRGESVEPVTQLEAEFGKPLWVFDAVTYDFASEKQLVCTYTENGVWHLATIHTETLTLQDLPVPYTDVEYPVATENWVTFWAGTPTAPSAIVQLDIKSGRLETLKASSQMNLSERYLSEPEPISYRTTDGKLAHAIYYAPKNDDFQAPKGELPPLIVMSHGGPTSATNTTFKPSIQYWTSRGFAVADVNYGGSTGYGRDYRDRLKGNWGMVDVDDCTHAALYLADQGKADRARLSIVGGSAGGYTTLAALTFKDVFAAGASHFGVSDLALLAKDTHKFESRYMDGLVGPYPEYASVYQRRSPLFAVDHLRCPVIFFQGLEDKVVPPNQAEVMVNSLREKGIPVAYVTFEGEGHGFRKAANIKRTLEAELYFYGRVFGFAPADDIEPVPVENLA